LKWILCIGQLTHNACHLPFPMVVYFNFPQTYGQHPEKPYLGNENNQTFQMVHKHGSKYVELNVK